MLWFAFRFFNFTGYTQRTVRYTFTSRSCDLLSDFLTLQDIHNRIRKETIYHLLWFAFRFFNFTGYTQLKLYTWLILNGLACVVQRKNPAIFSLDFFALYLFFGSYKSYNTGAWVWTSCIIMHVSAVIFLWKVVSRRCWKINIRKTSLPLRFFRCVR